MSEYKLWLGDCLEFMRTLDAGSVDAVITDPPYGVNISYGKEFDDTPEYAKSLAGEVLKECLRVSRGLVLWFGAAPRLQDDLENFSVKPHRVLIWHVSFSMASTQSDGMYYRYHPIYAWNLPKKQSTVKRDVISVAQNGSSDWWHHPGTKPIDLMTKLVSMPDGDTIFDPFMGSGTTGVACMQLGRNFIGCEIDPGYYAIAEKRISAAALQPPLFTLDAPEEQAEQAEMW